MKPFLVKFRQFSPATQARLALAVPGVALLLFLVLGRKPWTMAFPTVRKEMVDYYVAFYSWVAAAINFACVAGLALSASWWTRPMPQIINQTSYIKNPKWFWPLVTIAMVLTAWFGWPRLTQSFWHDEAYPIRHAIMGYYRPVSDGRLKLKEPSWKNTLFFCEKPNQTFYSAIARLLNDGWRKIARPKGLAFNEAVIRAPAYLAGIASTATIALMLSELGFPSAGVIAAFLFALHPWHVRYSSEARAYAFLLCLLPLVIWAFYRALKDGRWRWWAAFGALEFLLAFSYPTCVYVLLVLNLCAPFAIYFVRGKSPEALVQGGRWLVANVFAGMAFLQLLLPCIPQLIAYVKGQQGNGYLDFTWTSNFLSRMLTGNPWKYEPGLYPTKMELSDWFVYHPGLGVLIVFLAVLFLTLGIRRMIAANALCGLMVLPLLLPAVLCYIETRARDGNLLEWYLIFLLPGAIAVVAVGLDELIAAARSRTGKFAAVAVVVLLVSSYGAWTAPERAFLMRQSIQPERESVLLTRPSLNPNDPRQDKILTATFYGRPDPYDPRILSVRTAAELGELTRRADAEGKVLYINVGYLVTVRYEHPNKYQLLKNAALFEDLGVLPGLEPNMQSRQVFRYKPGSAAGFDFSKIPGDRGRPHSGYSY